MTMPRARPNNGVATAAIFAVAIGLSLALAAYVINGARSSLSVALGAVVAVVNLLAMRAIITSLIVPPDDEKNAEASRAPNDDDNETTRESNHKREGRRGGLAWGLFAVFKIFILFGVIGLLLTRKIVDPIPFVVGYGALPLGIVASTFATMLSPRWRRRP